MTRYEYYKQISDVCFEISGVLKMLQDLDLSDFYANCSKNYDKKIDRLSCFKANEPAGPEREKRLNELIEFKNRKRGQLVEQEKNSTNRN